MKAKPEASNATVAKQVKADDKTVAKVRRKLESTSEIPKLEKTVGADGKSRPKTKKEPKAAISEKDVERDRKECVALYQKVLDAEREQAEWLVDDIVNRAIALVAAMDDEQRRQFRDRYIKLYGVA